MSTDWHVHCLDCKETLALDENRSVRLPQTLIRHAAAIAALAPLIAEADFGGYLDGWTSCNGSLPIDPAFFAKHLGHRLIAQNEYGQATDECGMWVRCQCGRTDHCRLAPDHDGDHNPKRPE